MDLLEAILKKDARVGIIGLGYVGLPLSQVFCRGGFRVTGFDVDPEKIRKLAAGESYIGHIPGSQIADLVRGGRFSPTGDFAKLGEVDAIIICVPTPLTESREPDLGAVAGTARTIAANLRRGQLVVLESTTYPGTTEDFVR